MERHGWILARSASRFPPRRACLGQLPLSPGALDCGRGVGAEWAGGLEWVLEGFVPASVVACYYDLGERLVHVLSAVCLTVLSAIPYIGLRSLSTHPPSFWTSLHYTTRRPSPACLVLFLPSSLPRFPVAYAGVSFACPNHLPWASSSLFLVLVSRPMLYTGLHSLPRTFLSW